MKKILLAVGNEDLSVILKRNLTKDFAVCEQEVFHHRYLEEILENERPDFLIVHDTFLESDSPNESRDEEWLQTIQRIRYLYDTDVRVVFLCEREVGDEFLNALVTQFVLDIFNERVINTGKMIEQLKEKPKYSNVAYFATGTIPTTSPIQTGESLKIEEQPKQATKERPIVQKVIEKKIVEKKVVQKVVNKNVIKRELKINILSNSDEKEIVNVAIEPKIIVIGGAFSRVGSTFVSHLLTKTISSKNISVSYIENPYGYSYTFDRYFGEESYQDYISLFSKETRDVLSSSVDAEKQWFKDNINLVVLNPLHEKKFGDEVDFDVFYKILLKQKSPIQIIDVGTDWNKPVYKELIDIADEVYLVVDADPIATQILIEQQPYEYLFKEGFLKPNINVILNKASAKIAKDSIFTEVYEEVYSIPLLDTETVFSYEVNRKWLLDDKHLAEKVLPHIEAIIKEFIPSSFLENKPKEKKRFGFLPKISIERG